MLLVVIYFCGYSLNTLDTDPKFKLYERRFTLCKCNYRYGENAACTCSCLFSKYFDAIDSSKTDYGTRISCGYLSRAVGVIHQYIQIYQTLYQIMYRSSSLSWPAARLSQMLVAIDISNIQHIKEILSTIGTRLGILYLAYSICQLNMLRC